MPAGADHGIRGGVRAVRGRCASGYHLTEAPLISCIAFTEKCVDGIDARAVAGASRTRTIVNVVLAALAVKAVGAGAREVVHHVLAE